MTEVRRVIRGLITDFNSSKNLEKTSISVLGNGCRKIDYEWCRYLLHWHRIWGACLIEDWKMVGWLMEQGIEEAALDEVSE